MSGDMSDGGCHCGRIRFQVEGRPETVLICNCSICRMKAYLHWIVPQSVFHLRTARSDIATYKFNTQVATHCFCPICGVAPFYIPRSDPDKVDVNARCLVQVDVDRLTAVPYDGRNWEAAFARYKS